jgi:hypothetical protein
MVDGGLFASAVRGDPACCGEDPSPRLPTARFWDRISWAAVLSLGDRLSEMASRRRLELALKDEVAFWKRLEAKGGDVE